MHPSSAVSSHPCRTDSPPSPGYLARRLQHAPPGAQREIALLRRRRRVARCLVCGAGAIAFFGLYALSWLLVL